MQSGLLSSDKCAMYKKFLDEKATQMLIYALITGWFTSQGTSKAPLEPLPNLAAIIIFNIPRIYHIITVLRTALVTCSVKNTVQSYYF